MAEETKYGADQIRSLEWHEHIRLRPGMYIGKLGDGSQHDDGIYILIKEVIDNSIDEFVMGNGRTIDLLLLRFCITLPSTLAKRDIAEDSGAVFDSVGLARSDGVQTVPSQGNPNNSFANLCVFASEVF